MFGLGIPEIILIALAVGVLFFGGSRMLNFTKSLGRLSGEFKKGKMEVEKELEEARKEAEDITHASETDAPKA